METNQSNSTDSQTRANNLFEALRQLCGVDTKEEAESMLNITLTMPDSPEAVDASKALTVLIKEWQ